MLWFIEKTAYALGVIGGIALLLPMCLVVIFDIGSRLLLGSGLPWAVDAGSVMMVSFVFAILPWSLVRGSHIRMDILYIMAGHRFRIVADFIAILGAATFFGLIGWGAINTIPRYLRIGTGSPNVSIPYWPFAALILFVCALSLVILVLQIFGRMKKPEQILHD
ncbi:TRAP transporter small permease subunit [Maritimibacter sp. DP07]|uniref:TRAP transporter small permease protein n=1 Tax=Maritimibacter harenae TaxID=2606218 RepID=A0A845M2A5_9RHOB|nr:TRAP transporter small permease [Maritimibacter harenae]MZR13696.1 TRAP transporter small permease subunit [Maritimibacter harenae]